ncbi:2'-5' RNA ligase family protein [Nonomuraea angiospora]|uniref:2'-5' RNA ligase family protein n=1 Tax=Nonomuraea angiospora TaxID=46172 RepID=UPI0029AB516F|nr:2'-5' RNA ligase family protein [Nonomuraea angiospora]MDX3103882.1 2'-5' RNA ligase family protein [Nonomuraea angiospora]
MAPVRHAGCELSAGGAAPYPVGATVLVVPVPEAEPVVGGQRALFDPSARFGVSAHVTVLYPFLPRPEIGEATVAELAGLFAGHRPFEAAFTGCARFPGLLYLGPEPAEPFAALTRSVTARWPALRPYGGRYGEAVPHLSVGYGDDQVLDGVESAVAPGLPFATRVTSVDLASFDGLRWTPVARFPLRQSRISQE